MSEKRRDNKNRILRTGESQRSDGRYEYKYTDILGKRKSVYSWRLVSTDLYKCDYYCFYKVSQRILKYFYDSFTTNESLYSYFSMTFLFCAKKTFGFMERRTKNMLKIYYGIRRPEKKRKDGKKENKEKEA